VSSSYGSAIGTARVSSVGNPYLFTGRRMHFFETEFTGLGPEPNTPIQYNRARHYDPQHGRWLQREPLGYVDGMNLYEYVESNPSRSTDPTGLNLRRTAPEAYKGPWKGVPTNKAVAGPCDCACIVELYNNAAFDNPFGQVHITIQVQDCQCQLWRIDGAAQLSTVRIQHTLFDGMTGRVLSQRTTGARQLETLSLDTRKGKAFSGFVRRLLKTKNCARCKRLLTLAELWNDKAHPYRAALGPNSNSAAGVLLKEAGLGTWRPPGALHWRYLFGIYPPYRIGTNQPDYVIKTSGMTRTPP
jgi:RHS repeat-associated protein